MRGVVGGGFNGYETASRRAFALGIYSNYLKAGYHPNPRPENWGSLYRAAAGRASASGGVLSGLPDDRWLFDGYSAVAKTEGIEHLACWTDVRRRFVDAARVQPNGKHGHADGAVVLIGKRYGIERDHKDADDKVSLLARRQHSVPALAALDA